MTSKSGVAWPGVSRAGLVVCVLPGEAVSFILRDTTPARACECPRCGRLYSRTRSGRIRPHRRPVQDSLFVFVGVQS